MRRSIDLLNAIRIASPCHAAWDAMAGDDLARHCGSCDKTVYNLSGMTSDAAAALFQEREGRICVRLWRRPDGTVLTADCPVGRLAKMRRRMRRAAMAVAAWLGLMPAGCTKQSEACIMGGPIPFIPQPEVGPMPRVLPNDGTVHLMGTPDIDIPVVEFGPMPREVK